MSHDELNGGARDGEAMPPEATPLRGSGANVPDEGMIHEWLDGQLDDDTSAKFDALVMSSPEFAERVAEARGFIAASSRILSSLDAVPAGVIPNKSAVLQTKPLPWRRWGSIAALLMVGVTGVVVMQREPDAIRIGESTVALSDGATSLEQDASSLLPESRVGAVSGAASTANMPSVTDSATETTTARDNQRDLQIVPDRASAKVSSAPARAFEEARDQPRVQDSRAISPPESLRSPVELTGGRVAADPAQRASLQAQRSALAGAASPPPTQSLSRSNVSANAAPTAAAGVERFETDAPMFADVQSDIARDELALAVQRVRCTPNCEQVRVEFALDGRLRRWIQHSVAGGASPDTAHISPEELNSLRQLADSVGLASLPAMVRLDGARCTWVGALRESLRVEFRHNNTMRSVMGLPWCSDGKHALDRISNAADSLAAVKLGPVRRR